MCFCLHTCLNVIHCMSIAEADNEEEEKNNKPMAKEIKGQK